MFTNCAGALSANWWNSCLPISQSVFIRVHPWLKTFSEVLVGRTLPSTFSVSTSRRMPLNSSAMSDTLVVNEVYLSLQGESTFAGLPCVFVRLTACNLRCSYCDTAYAFTEGEKQPLDEILSEVRRVAKP